ncbi:hypothetical protein ES703_03040 [subsurface metagenome]
MKLGIFMLVFGLIIAGAGITAWVFAAPYVDYYQGSRLTDVAIDVQLTNACGIGATVIGGGLAIGGIVRIIVKR